MTKAGKIAMSMLAACGLAAWVPQARAEWVSPIPEQAEIQAPCNLLPFPQKVEWMQGNLAFGKKIDFEVRKFKIPFASMKRQNNLTIACSSPGYNKLGTPYIGVNYIVLKKSK